MPNWLIHAGAAGAGSLALEKRTRMIPFFILGSVLPDVTAIAYLVLLDLAPGEPVSHEFILWYFQPFHTPFLALFYCTGIAVLFAAKEAAVLLNLYLGCLSHFLLDSFQRTIGYHQLLAYPFSFRDFNPGLIDAGNAVFPVLTLVSTVFLTLLVVLYGRLAGELPRVTAGRTVPFLCVLAVVLTVPFTTRDMFYRNNFHYLRFFAGIEDYEGRELELGVSRIENLSPLVIRELDRRITLGGEPPAGLKEGDWISVRGTWSCGSLKVSEMMEHTGYRMKIYTSIAGFVAVLAVFLRNFTRRRTA